MVAYQVFVRGCEGAALPFVQVGPKEHDNVYVAGSWDVSFRGDRAVEVDAREVISKCPVHLDGVVRKHVPKFGSQDTGPP